MEMIPKETLEQLRKDYPTGNQGNSKKWRIAKHLPSAPRGLCLEWMTLETLWWRGILVVGSVWSTERTNVLALTQ